MTQESPLSLSDRYYHWLASIYARLIDTEQRAIDRQTDQLIDEASDEHLHPAGVYHPDMVDTLRLEIAAARQTLRHDRSAFAEEWRTIEADLAVKLLSVADPTEVQLNALRSAASSKKS
ncbi:hypothetical protein [Halothiobacillus sp. DCM-1]|uniref:hypothetical protein n=1 Tax=Halothiobacillus sp. DCM-1 TaxID=3112558 RepID=UPI0032471B67